MDNPIVPTTPTTPVAQKPETKNPAFKVGDIVRVITRSFEEKKINPAPFEGIVMAFGGSGTDRTFTVRKIGTNQVAVEKIFPVKSPYIESVKVIKNTRVRRAKLYYLRQRRNIT
ncbi:MAG: 50S ribosomal protein L19 [Candidatus Curtissbacteria bacterium]|nr:50S ribosomal protein L19 [Candidatus Curtissbacteria bacterium]